MPHHPVIALCLTDKMARFRQLCPHCFRHPVLDPQLLGRLPQVLPQTKRGSLTAVCGSIP